MDDVTDISIEAPAEQDTPQSKPGTDVSELDGLFGEVDGDEPSEEAEEPEGEEEAEEGEKPEPKALVDDSEIDLEDGRKVRVKELKETFATFTRKTQELAEDKRATLQQAREAVAQHAEAQAHELHLIAQSIHQLVAPGFDAAKLNQLAYEDPATYYQVKARLEVADAKRAELQGLVQQQLRIAQEQRGRAQEERAQSYQQQLDGEGEKLRGQKWFTDDFRAKATAYAKSKGVPEQVAKGVAYAGFVEIIREAMLYRDAVARSKAGKQPPKQAAVVPGASPARGALGKTKHTEALFSRARKTNRYEDIGNALDKIL